MRALSRLIFAALWLSLVCCESPEAEVIRHGEFVQFVHEPAVVMLKSSVEVQYNCSAAYAVDLLTFPFASTGEKFGVLHTFFPFKNRGLEWRRAIGVKQPRVTLSLWIYLLSPCSQPRCAIVKHIDDKRRYGSPLVMLTDTGNIVVQVQMVNGEDQAFTAHSHLPLLTWIRLDLFIEFSKANLTVTRVSPAGNTLENTYRFDFRLPILFNDTSGYFVLGGSSYLTGFRGYFGTIRFYRLGSEKANVCYSYYKEQKRRFAPRNCSQTWSWDQQRRFNFTFKLLDEHQRFFTGKDMSARGLPTLSEELFWDALKLITEAGQSEDRWDVVSPAIARLQLSSCWGHHSSSLLLTTLLLAGLGSPVNIEQAHVYSLVAGVSDDRRALMHLGYKHMQGIDGFPKDLNMAYGYYANMAKQTSIDRKKLHDSRQILPEHVHLSSKDELHAQMGESGDIVQYLKHKAERGDVGAQKSLARMLLWGSNGVDKDLQAAAVWYAKSAQQMDPVAIYDYAILLLKGTGVKKNRTLGFELLEKAAEMGFVEALNGLGWYYSSIVKDGRKAMEFFELAAQNGSRDGLFNVGVYKLNGANPDKPERNESGAFHYFLRAAHLGHVDGAIESASFLSTGDVSGVPRDPDKAVGLLKQVSETNGNLGLVLKDALQTYQKGSWDEALVKYAMLAETGFAVAQLNSAHLCQLLGHSSVCQLRYHNLSTYNHVPQETGLLQMGDYYREQGDTVKMIEMYSVAARHGSPQGLFNLAMLIEECFEIPDSTFLQMGIVTADVNHSPAEQLLIRCRELEEGDLTPCSLVLWSIGLVRAWRGFSHSSLQLALACGITAAFVFFIFTELLRTLHAHYSSSNQSSERNNASALTGQETRNSRPESTSQQQQIHWSTRSPSHPSLQETSDALLTVTGVCACFLCTLFISHLL
ncbi:hypothetical protein DNTS_021325 [Danionella cerebrum]|uniref:Uncharacterized protein n=1 Tax=Danionella cerebrum TaxID=2873325 RepID=A0A553MNZ9_9TELE|nr:hypothetical protein DNTS_021325 [Danionella translucida]